jgi:hypothetical protein
MACDCGDYGCGGRPHLRQLEYLVPLPEYMSTYIIFSANKACYHINVVFTEDALDEHFIARSSDGLPKITVTDI